MNIYDGNLMQHPNINRPLYINFESYTEGDNVFKAELITLLISNMHDLQESLKKANDQKNENIFRLSSHKVKPSLSMLNDIEFNVIVENLNEKTFDIKSGEMFNQICNAIIKSLEKEVTG